jgi:hypothetical protein
LEAVVLIQSQLKEVLDYHPETGLFVWKVRASNRVGVGVVAGTTNKDGYIVIGYKGCRYMAHLLAYLWMEGVYLIGEVDHKDTNPSNNRWVNLRPATRTENARNTNTPKSNSSGAKGVTWHRASKKWRAFIKVNGKQIHLGLFSSFDEAVAKRAKATVELHGEFSNYEVKP